MKQLLILFAFLTIFGSQRVDARQGGDVGNGGDSLALEFVSIGQSILKHWEELDYMHAHPVSKDQFARAVRETRVYSTDESLYVEDFAVDAKNHPFCTSTITVSLCGVIQVQQQRWNRIQDSAKKTLLVYHEYLGVLGIENRRFDDFYEASSLIYERLSQRFHTQKKISLNFTCIVEAWNREQNRVVPLLKTDTYDLESVDNFITLNYNGEQQSFVLILNKIILDIFSPTLKNELRYNLFRFHPTHGMEVNALKSGIFEFTTSGRRSLRLLQSPELQLSCYRTLDSM